MRIITFLLNLSIIAVAMIFMGSCSNEDSLYENDVTVNEERLNLQSPSGEYLAEDIDLLKEKLAPIIEQGHGESKDFEVISIHFEALSVGFTADIEYKTKDGIESNVIVTNRKETSIQKTKTRSPEGSSDGSGEGSVSYKCKKSPNGKCKSCRTINDEKHDQIRCACDNGLVEGCELYEYKY